MSIYLLMEWMNTGSNQKSVGEIDRLSKDVLRNNNFKLDDIADFSVQTEQKRLDKSDKEDGGNSPFGRDGWVESDISISIPTGTKNGQGQQYSVPGLHHRSLLEVMKSALADVTA